jgi:hypothetical protein
VIGKTLWAIPGGRIPMGSCGREPEFTSHERLCILNIGNHDASVELLLFYGNREPVGPYEIIVPARRVFSFRLNDLIDPAAIPLDTDYAMLLESDVPVVIQLVHQDTRQSENSTYTTMAFALD